MKGRFALPILLLLMAGCLAPPAESPPAGGWPPQVQVADPELADALRIGRVRQWRDSANLLHVEVPLRSSGDASLLIQYRVQFTDANGTPLDDFGPWQLLWLSDDTWHAATATCWSSRGQAFVMQVAFGR